ncbi:MAG: NUDIX hydrolase [Dehalococcoidia bacterium]|nr:NUDIX hydrolase [Dehalococcoidia bacterium]
MSQPSAATAPTAHFETVASAVAYRARAFTLRADRVRLPNGEERTVTVIDHPGCAVIVPVDDQARVLLIRQHRYATGKRSLEAPAGRIDPGEDPLACARRELQEETGFRAADFTFLGAFYTSDGISNELAHLFLARGLTPGPPNPQEEEAIELEWLDLDEAVRHVETGVVECGPTALALLLASARLRRAPTAARAVGVGDG